MAENGHTARYSHSTVIDMDPVSPHAPADNFSFHGSVNDLELNRDDHSHYQQHQPDSIPPTAPNLDLFRRNINSSLSKLRKRKRPSAVSPGSSQQPSFDNEETTDLLIQLRNDLQIYTRADSSPQAATDLPRGRGEIRSASSSRSNSPARSPRSLSPAKSPEGSSPMNAYFPSLRTRNHGEMSVIVDTLADIVMNDCTYLVSTPKPSRPPYALHSVVVDIAIVLVQHDNRNLAWLYEIGMTLLPAFDVFPSGPLTGKLLILYLDWIIPNLIIGHYPTGSRGVLGQRHIEREGYHDYHIQVANTRSQNRATPTINIQQAERENTARKNGSGLTIETGRSSSIGYLPEKSLARRASSVSGSHSAELSIDSYYTYALFTPLLQLMIQHLNPYFAAKRSNLYDKVPVDIFQESTKLLRFYQALEFMISQKTDIYLDLLDIISYGSSEVRTRATQILFHYYGRTLGHISIAEPLPKIGYREQMVLIESENRASRAERDRQAVVDAMRPGGTFNMTNLNRRNRTNTFPLNGNEYLDHEVAESVHVDEVANVDQPHVFFSYMFPEGQQRSSHDVGASVNRTSQGLQYLNIQSTNDDQSSNCRECFKIIRGYGLRCFSCRDSLHYNCYNQKMSTDFLDVLQYVSDGDVHKVVSPQFCTINSMTRSEKTMTNANPSTSSYQITLNLHGHNFQLVNLFTLTLCLCCRLPLWGISYQGYHCSTCNRFVHADCVLAGPHGYLDECKKQAFTEQDILIESQKLEDDFKSFYADILAHIDLLYGTSFEEAGTLLNLLLLQENALHCGVSAGCLVVVDEQSNPLANQAGESSGQSNISQELHAAIEKCKTYLRHGNPKGSIFMSDLCTTNNYHVDDMILSDELYLSHITAMMKSQSNRSRIFSDRESTYSTSPNRRSGEYSSGLLQVSTNRHNAHAGSNGADNLEETLVPNEMLQSHLMLEWVENNLRFKSTFLNKILLQHLSDIGLFERWDGYPILFAGNPKGQGSVDSDSASLSVPCIFTVPFAIDASPSVESLITAIDACLSDMSLSINEYGLLLLTRRCWPDPFTSQYTWERLIYAVLKWIYQEDEQLSTIHAEYTAQEHSNSTSRNRWHMAAQAALMARNRGGFVSRNRQSVQILGQAGVGVGTGDVYVSIRNLLRDKYLTSWISAVYELNKDKFAEIIFEMTKRIAAEKNEAGNYSPWSDKDDVAHKEVVKQNYFLTCLSKAKSFGILFSSFDAIMEYWMDMAFSAFEAHRLLDMDSLSPMKALQRLSSQKATVSSGSPDHRVSVAMNGTAADDSSSNIYQRNLEQPYKSIVKAFDRDDLEGYSKGIKWINLLMHSGVGLPTVYLAKFARKLTSNQSSLSLQVELLKCIWYQAIKGLGIATSRADVRDVIGYLNECTLPKFKELEVKSDISEGDLKACQDFIRYSAALTCFAFWCPMTDVLDLQIVPYVHQLVPTKPERTSFQPDNTSNVEIDDQTIIIKCLLEYLKMDGLNVREELILTFYALSNWGFDIANKSDFLASCLPAITPAIWEVLTPAYDRMSDITLTFLMKTLTLDVKYFRACVYGVFQDNNWEVRFQALDNAFGIFTKMDATFQRKWLGMLSHLGPLFSYFVSSIWDKEEPVRTKATSYIRTLSTLHRRSAFRCWEAYFLNSTTTQKIDLVKIMTQLHALYPEWQVLEWESLLETLEMDFQADEYEGQYNVLDEYVRPESYHPGMSSSSKEGKPKTNVGQALAEHENLQIMMLTLALQMVGSNLSMTVLQLSRLKYCIVRNMGFQNCEKFHTSGTTLEVTFSNLVFNTDDFTQSSMIIACTRGLKKVLDTYTPVDPESIATIGPDAMEKLKEGLAENISYGKYFVDIVLKMFDSGVDLTQLNHLMLKVWLELVLIVVYKHDILDRSYENMIISCMKQVIDLLIRDISEENKLLILQILHQLHKRSDHLTAMVLSKQIMALGKLMTKHKENLDDPVLLKAKYFLKSAFMRFAIAGLFVLMFKNQAVSDENNHDVDLFFVLRTVIDPGDLVPEEGLNEVIYLRDQPVRDVLEKLMNQQMERRAFSNVLHNVARYVEEVHSHPYSESVLSDFGIFLTSLCKHTQEWRRSEWDINPVLSMSATLLKEHPYDSKSLLLPIRTVFKHALHHCTVTAESIVKLLAAYSAVSTLPGTDPINVFGQIVIEELKGSFQNRSRMNRETVLCMLEVIFWDSKPEYQWWFKAIEDKLVRNVFNQGRHPPSYFQGTAELLYEDLTHSLENGPSSRQYSQREFKISNCASQLLVIMCLNTERLLPQILGLQHLHETRKCLRFLNWFLLGLARNGSPKLIRKMLSYQDVIAELLIQVFTSINIDYKISDLKFQYSTNGEVLLQCVLLTKVWSLLYARIFLPVDSQNTRDASIAIDTPALVKSEHRFWGRIWPTWKRVIDRAADSLQSETPNVGLAILSMTLSVVQFLLLIRSDIPRMYEFEWCTLLDALVAYEPVSATDVGADIEGIRGMFDTPPPTVSLDTLIDQLLLEMREALRLQAEGQTQQVT